MELCWDHIVNGYNYLQMINSFAAPQLQEQFNNQFNGVFQRFWWFQDGAPAHRLKAVKHRIHEIFAKPKQVFARSTPGFLLYISCIFVEHIF